MSLPKWTSLCWSPARWHLPTTWPMVPAHAHAHDCMTAPRPAHMCPLAGPDLSKVDLAHLCDECKVARSLRDTRENLAARHAFFCVPLMPHAQLGQTLTAFGAWVAGWPPASPLRPRTFISAGLTISTTKAKSSQRSWATQQAQCLHKGTIPGGRYMTRV